MKAKTFLLILVISLLVIGSFIIVYRKLTYSNLIQNFQSNKIKLNTILTSKKLVNKIDVPIYYINLDRSPERKKFMEDQFRKYNISNYKRIPAIDGKKISNILHDTIDGITFTNNYVDLIHNEVGCLLSHLKAIKTAYDNGLDQVLILEDDCSLDLMVFWKNNLTAVLENLGKPDWEVFQLYTGNCIDFKSKSCTLQTGKKDCWGCVAYLINRRGMEKIVNFIETDNRNEIILGKYTQNNNLFPSKGPSDIFIYQIATTYYLDTPLFCPNNSNLKSTLISGSQPDKLALTVANNIIDNYIKEFTKNTSQ